MFATLPMAELLGEQGKAETNPPLFYIVLNAWVSIFGESEASLRTPSAIFSILSLFFTYYSGLYLKNRRTGLIAAAISAVMVEHIYYAQEARTYTLLLLGATISVAGFSRLFANPEQAGKTIGKGFDWMAWGLYLLGTSVSLYAHNTGVFVPSSLTAAAIISFLVKPKRYGLGFAINWLIVNLAVIVIWLPWIFVILNQVSDMSSFWINMPKPMDLIKTPMQLYIPIEGSLRLLSKTAIVATGLAFLVYCWKKNKWDLLCMLFLLTGSVFIQAYLASYYQPIFIPRLFIWTLPMFALILAIGAESLRKPILIYSVSALLIAMNCIGLKDYYRKADKEYWDELALAYQALDNHKTLKLLQPADIHMPLGYYLEDADALNEESIGIVDGDPKETTYGSHLVKHLVSVDKVTAAVVGRERLLVVVRGTLNSDPTTLLSNLESEFQLTEKFRRGHIAIYEALRKNR